MKLWSSFVKELTIAARGFYFYIEIGMAVVLILVLLFAIPNDFVSKDSEYLYLDFPSEEIKDAYVEAFGDLDGEAEVVELKAGKKPVSATLYETETKEIYILYSEQDMVELAKKKHKIGASIVMDETGEIDYTYYTQGNETKKFNNLIYIIHGENDKEVYDRVENQPVKVIGDKVKELSDRENLLPSFLTFNGAFMGFFIMAAYIFLDKKEGVIKAYAVSPSSMRTYLMSKVLVLTTTSLITSLLMVVPVMKTQVNYLLIILLLIPAGFFASTLGLFLASFYDDISKSFGVLYLLLIGLMLPGFGYYIPSWDPAWLKLFPTYYVFYGFKEILVQGSVSYILTICGMFLVGSAILFELSSRRYQKTLSV